MCVLFGFEKYKTIEGLILTSILSQEVQIQVMKTSSTDFFQLVVFLIWKFELRSKKLYPYRIEVWRYVTRKHNNFSCKMQNLLHFWMFVKMTVTWLCIISKSELHVLGLKHRWFWNPTESWTLSPLYVTKTRQLKELC